MKKQMGKTAVWYLAITAILCLSCVEKNPSRDEIPAIKNLLTKFESAVREKNPARIDSFIVASADEQGYNSTRILADVYDFSEGAFYAFGRKEFFYTKNKGIVSCRIMANSADSGRAVEITVEKVADRWLIKKFDLK
jgi:hypothetical protein